MILTAEGEKEGGCGRKVEEESREGGREAGREGAKAKFKIQIKFGTAWDYSGKPLNLLPVSG